MDETELTRGLARVRGRSGQIAGAGCLVLPRTVLTCAHVVEKALGRQYPKSRPVDAVLIDFPHCSDIKPVKATVAKDGWFPVDRERGDVAVLELHADPPPDSRQPPLRRPPVLMDHPFHVEGFPAKIEDAWATGVIRGSTHGGHWVQLEDVKVPGHRIEPGFSGAPVWDDQAEAVVGMIVVAESDATTKTARMIPVTRLQSMWKPLEGAIGWRLRYDEAESDKHWKPRARGLQRGRGGRSPWLFTGRTPALRELVSWLDEEETTHGRVVIGGPGSGKSAVISRLVTLSDPEVRDETPVDSAPDGTLPRIGVIDVAVHARGKTLDMIVAKVATWLDVCANSADDLVTALIDRGRPCVIVIDALDEASGMDAVRIAAELLNPLATDGSEAGVKVIVGTRRGPSGVLLRKLSGLKPLNLDDRSKYFDQRDLAEYAHRILMAGNANRASPYTGRSDVARDVADAVAHRAAPSFLLAQLASQTIAADTTVIDVDRADWEKDIPRDVGQAMEEYLGRFGVDEQRVRDLLLPLAFAEGGGLPRGESLWAALSEGLAGREYTDADITWLLDSAASDYLVESDEDAAGRGVFGLYHEELARHLRGDEPSIEAKMQTRFAQILIESVPRGSGDRRDWMAAEPYTRVHLATHAARAGRLYELISDPGFLLAADPTRLLRALPSAVGPDSGVIAGVYRSASTQIRDRAAGEAASYLELSAKKVGASALAERVAELDPPRTWSTRWVNWSATHAYLTVGQHGSDIASVAACVVDDEQVAVSGGDDGTVRVWSVEACQPLTPPLRGHTGRVTTIATAEIKGDPVAVTGGWDNRLFVWDLRTGTQIGESLGCHTAAITQVAIAEVNGRPIAVSASLDDTVGVWDLDRHTRLGNPMVANTHGVTAVAVGRVGGALIAVSAGYEVVRLWDLKRHEPVDGPPLHRHTGGIAALAIGHIDGRPVAVSGGWDQALWLWDLTSHRPVYEEPLGRHGGAITTVAFGHESGSPVVVSGAANGTIGIWDPHTRDSRVIDVGSAVFALALGEVEERQLAIGGGEGGVLRAWDLHTVPPASSQGTVRTRLTSVACPSSASRLLVTASDDGTLTAWSECGHITTSAKLGVPIFALAWSAPDDRPIALAGAWDGTLRAWDPRSGREADRPMGTHEGWIAGLSAGTLDGQPVVVSGGADGLVRLWDVRTRQELRKLHGHAGTVAAVALTDVDGVPVVVSAGADRVVRSWNLAESHDRGNELGKHGDEVLALAVGALDGLSIAASGGLDGCVRLWNLHTGLQFLEPLEAVGASITGLAMMRVKGRSSIVAGTGEERLLIWTADGDLTTIEIGSPVWGLAPCGGEQCAIACTLGLVVIDMARDRNIGDSAFRPPRGEG